MLIRSLIDNIYMEKQIKQIQDAMVSSLNFSQQEIDNVRNYSNELIIEIAREVRESECGIL